MDFDILDDWEGPDENRDDEEQEALERSWLLMDVAETLFVEIERMERLLRERGATDSDHSTRFQEIVPLYKQLRADMTLDFGNARLEFHGGPTKEWLQEVNDLRSDREAYRMIQLTECGVSTRAYEENLKKKKEEGED